MDEGFNVCHEEIVLHQHPFIKYQALDIKKIHSPLLLSTSKTHTQNFIQTPKLILNFLLPQ